MRRCALYSDFNCPFCYATHERLHGTGLIESVEWRGVQHAPHLSLPMQLWAGRLGAELLQEVAMVRRLAPEVPIAVPKGKPNTRPAIEAAACATRMDPGRAVGFIRSLYRLFWLEGKDISNSTLLREEGQRHGFEPRGISSTEAEYVSPLLDIWAREWAETDHAGVPLLEREDRRMLFGLVPADLLREFLAPL